MPLRPFTSKKSPLWSSTLLGSAIYGRCGWTYSTKTMQCYGLKNRGFKMRGQARCFRFYDVGTTLCRNTVLETTFRTCCWNLKLKWRSGHWVMTWFCTKNLGRALIEIVWVKYNRWCAWQFCELKIIFICVSCILWVALDKKSLFIIIIKK